MSQTPAAAPLRLGTRGSLLARTQSRQVADSITAATGRAVDLVVVRTEGDDLTVPLDSPSRPGAFAAALRDALLDGRIDLAVHSFKDPGCGRRHFQGGFRVSDQTFR